MAYIGKAPVNGFHSKQQLTGDGSTVTFTLDYTVASESSIIVSVGGVLQEPAVAFNLAQGGTKITFTEAPASTDRVYIQFLGQAVVQNLLDVNGAEFILDANADTSLTADTDDEIDIKIGGTDRSTIKATGFHNLDSIKFVAGTGDDMQMYHDGTNSYLTNSTGALKLATETSGIAVTIGHTTSEVTIADNATVAGNLTVTGTLTQTGTQTFDGGIDVDNFNINGTTIALSSGDMTLDSAGDIILDADGGDVFFKDAGTTFGSATNTSGNLIIKSGTTTAATFSGANVTFAGTLSATSLTADDVAIDGKVITMTGSSSDTAVLTAGTNGTLSIVTTDAAAAAANITITADGTAELAGTTVTLNSSGGITLDADGGTITFADAGSSLGTITSSGYSGTAAVATTVTITDNESTNENNAIIFTAGGDVDGGNIGLESDGDLTYNPSTGTLNVTNISVTGTQTIVNSVTMNASNAVIFEGATADAYETTLSTVDATADRTINLPNQSGTLPVLAAASATAITSTPEELNKLDGATVTVGEINLIDGDATVGTTAFADGDGLLHNDNGTMRVTSATTLKTYMMAGTISNATQNSITTMTGLTTTGALNAGSITSGFGTIDNGASAITTTGVITGGTVEATTDTAANDNAAMGYTAAEGLILTGQGSTNDVTIKNDADADVIEIPTGTTNVTVAGNLGVGGTAVANTDTDTSNTGNVTLDFSANQNFVLTLTGNTTLVNPSTEQVGQSGFIAFIQDGTGSRTVSLGTDYETAASAGLTLTATASATDLVPYLVVASGRILLGTPQLAFA